MAVIRLGRSIPLVAPRRRKAAAMTTTPSLQCPPATRLGARVEVFYEGSWVSATVLSGNLPTSAAIRVRIDGAPPGTGYRAIARCFVRAPSAACPEKSSSKNSIDAAAAAAAADDGSASTLPSTVTHGTAKAVGAAANGHASTSQRVVHRPSTATPGTRNVAFRSSGSVGKKRSCGRAPAPEPGNTAPPRKRPLEPTEIAGSQKKMKPGPGMGISRTVLQRWFEEVKPLNPNARMWRPPMHGCDVFGIICS